MATQKGVGRLVIRNAKSDHINCDPQGVGKTKSNIGFVCTLYTMLMRRYSGISVPSYNPFFEK